MTRPGVFSLEDKIYRLEKEIIERMRHKNRSSVSIASIIFRGGESALVLHNDGRWTVKSAVGEYTVNNPMIDKLLEKYALITDVEFQERVGNSNQHDYDCERMRLLAMEGLLIRKRPEILKNFTRSMKSVLESMQ